MGLAFLHSEFLIPCMMHTRTNMQSAGYLYPERWAIIYHVWPCGDEVRVYGTGRSLFLASWFACFGELLCFGEFFERNYRAEWVACWGGASQEIG
jgi:hypothetical protein